MKDKGIINFLNKIFYGIILGFSIMIPGLSGSTIAISMNLYDKIMYSLSNLYKEFKKSFIYLFPLGIGGIFGLVLGILLIKFLLNNSPFYMICYFSGLMIGAFPTIYKKGKCKFLIDYVLLIFGLLLPILMSIISINIKTSNCIIEYNTKYYLIFLFIGIALAITQLVPGLSATVFLMIIGYYNYFINFVNIDLFFNFKQLLVIIFVFIGLLLGIFMFSNVINYLLTKNKQRFYNLISGLSLSSILCVYFDENCLLFYKNISLDNIINTLFISIFIVITGILSYILISGNFEKMSFNEKK